MQNILYNQSKRVFYVIKEFRTKKIRHLLMYYLNLLTSNDFVTT